MSNISNPDDDLMAAQQEKDLRHPTKSQPEKAKSLRRETFEERIETDLTSNEGIGAAVFSERPKSETEEALERARRKVREHADIGRRRRSR